LTPAIAIFVKTPGLSPVKTRLGTTYGVRAAEEWHRRSARCVATTARASGLPVYWAVAEAEGMQNQLWQDLPKLAQGEGGLGTRMAVVHTELVERHGGGILIGADLPQIEPRHLNAAASWVDSPDPRLVLGPAHDGGFWLFGANRALDTAVWESVHYSCDDTAHEFIKAVDAPAKAMPNREMPTWEMLEPLTDLDLADDLPAVLRELRAVEEPNGPQRQLALWLAQRIEQAA